MIPLNAMTVLWTVLVPLVEEELEAIGMELRRAGVDAVAVAFLHAYANPEHERRAAAVLSNVLPGVVVTTSSEVSLQAREYERANTAVVNAYVAENRDALPVEFHARQFRAVAADRHADALAKLAAVDRHAGDARNRVGHVTVGEGADVFGDDRILRRIRAFL